MVGVFTIPLK